MSLQLLDRLRLRLQGASPCPACDGVMHGLLVRLAPGQTWQGPYWQCQDCDRSFHTEGRSLVDSSGTNWPLSGSRGDAGGDA